MRSGSFSLVSPVCEKSFVFGIKSVDPKPHCVPMLSLPCHPSHLQAKHAPTAPTCAFPAFLVPGLKESVSEGRRTQPYKKCHAAHTWTEARAVTLSATSVVFETQR